jgi:hypothetical protein
MKENHDNDIKKGKENHEFMISAINESNSNRIQIRIY